LVYEGRLSRVCRIGDWVDMTKVMGNLGRSRGSELVQGRVGTM